jgi:hypothetical protein
MNKRTRRGGDVKGTRTHCRNHPFIELPLRRAQPSSARPGSKGVEAVTLTGTVAYRSGKRDPGGGEPQVAFPQGRRRAVRRSEPWKRKHWSD